LLEPLLLVFLLGLTILQKMNGTSKNSKKNIRRVIGLA